MKKLPVFELVLLVLAGLWLYGFLSFVGQIQNMQEPGVQANLTKTDAIVVVTGGSERVMTGIELLESGIGQKLLISGVHKNLTLDNLLGIQPVPAALRSCCIILGYQADSTIGNAEEARAWMQSQAYKSMRLVTANYHMPRTLLLFRTAMPDVNIFPHPIAPDSVKLSDWWEHPNTIQLLATEYTKFLIADVKIRMDEHQ